VYCNPSYVLRSILHAIYGDQVDDSEAAGIGDVEPGIISVVTPLPAMGHRHHHKKGKKKVQESFNLHKEDPEAGAPGPDGEGDA
jgi:hypothetical protein